MRVHKVLAGVVLGAIAWYGVPLFKPFVHLALAEIGRRMQAFVFMTTNGIGRGFRRMRGADPEMDRPGDRIGPVELPATPIRGDGV